MRYSLFGNPYIVYREGKYYLDGIAADNIIKGTDTPVFCFLKRRIISNILRLKKNLKTTFKRYRILYSVKSNYLPDILKTVAETHIGFSLISDYEYKLLQYAAVKSDQIWLGGPYLTEGMLQIFREKPNIRAVIYLRDQLKYFIANKDGKEINNIIIRVKTPYIRHPIYGIDMEELIDINNLSHLQIKGLLIHIGTSIMDEKPFIQNTEYLITTIIKLEHLGINIEEVNFGGGFPLSVSFSDKKQQKLFREINERFNERGLEGITFIFEPGRYIVGDAGVCLLKIIGIGPNGFFIDGGNHILPRYAKNPYRFYNLNRPPSGYNRKVNIYGILPTGDDIIVRDYMFHPDWKIGDRILVLNTGAYCHTFSTRFPYTPPEYLMISENGYFKMDNLVRNII